MSEEGGEGSGVGAVTRSFDALHENTARVRGIERSSTTCTCTYMYVYTLDVHVGEFRDITIILQGATLSDLP